MPRTRVIPFTDMGKTKSKKKKKKVKGMEEELNISVF